MPSSRLLLLCVLFALPASAADDLSKLIKRAQAAAGGAAFEQVGAIAYEGRIVHNGKTGTVTGSEDLVTGRSVMRFALGPTRGGEGYDGATAWALGPGGDLRIGDSPTVREQAANQAWLTARAWLFPKRRAGELSLTRTAGEGARRYEVLTATPAGGRALELWFDAASARLARVVDRDGDLVITTQLEDYQQVGEVWLPFRSRVNRGDPRYDVVIERTRITLDPALAADAFAPPAAAGGAFAEGATSTTLPFRLLNNHTYVQAVVDGRPLTLLLDTGGVNLLTPKVAAALGLEASAEGGAALSEVRARNLELGAFALSEPLFYVADLGRLPEIEGVAFDGLIGHEVFKDLVVTIDYAARRITLTKPAAFVAPAEAARLPFELADRMPLIDGEVDGMKGRFTLDTGARSSVTLSAPFVMEHGLLLRYPRRHETTTGWGLGGPTRAYATRAGWLKLGPLEVKAPVLELSSAVATAGSDRYIAGSVGGGALRRFTVSIDFVGRALYLQPNADIGAPDLFDRSGMWINLDGEELIVDDLLSNGPAARAQVQKHDRIVNVDGVPATQLPLLDLRAKLRELPKGNRVKMTLRRDSKVVYANIMLDDLVPPP